MKNNSEMQGKLNLNDSYIYYHGKELKFRSYYLGFSFLITFFICYYYSFEILYLFVKPFLSYEKNFIFTDLTEAFYTTIKLSFIISFYILIPFIIYHIWCFFIPSSFLQERQKYNFFFITIVILLIMSISFIYFIVLPELYKFLLDFEITTNFMNIQLEARIQSYVGLACDIFFFFSILFQVPLFCVIAFQYDLITSRFLVKNRSHIFLLNLFLSAFISPPDVLTQILLALCLQITCEILILIMFIFNKSK